MAEAVVLVPVEGLSFWGRIGRSIRIAARWVKQHVAAAWSWTTSAVSTAATATWAFTTKWATIGWAKLFAGGRWVAALIPRTIGWVGFAVSSVVGFLVNVLAWFFMGWGLIEFALFAVVILALAWVATRWDSYISGTFRWIGMKAPRQPYLEYIREYKASADEKDGAVVALEPEPEPKTVRWQDTTYPAEYDPRFGVQSVGKHKSMLETGQANSMEGRFLKEISAYLRDNGQLFTWYIKENGDRDIHAEKVSAKIRDLNFARFVQPDTVPLLVEVFKALMASAPLDNKKQPSKNLVSFLHGRIIALEKYAEDASVFISNNEKEIDAYASLVQKNTHQNMTIPVGGGRARVKVIKTQLGNGITQMGYEIRDAVVPQ